MVERSDEPGKGEGAPADIYETRIIGRFEELDRLLRTMAVDVGCTHPRFERLGEEKVALLAYSTMAQVEQLRGEGYAVELGENVSRRAGRLKGEIGSGDRFEGGKIAPKGLGRKPGAGDVR